MLLCKNTQKPLQLMILTKLSTGGFNKVSKFLTMMYIVLVTASEFEHHDFTQVDNSNQLDMRHFVTPDK